MESHPRCIEREQKNRWVGRIYEGSAADGSIEYTYAIIAPLQFSQGHVVDPLPTATDAEVPRPYRDLEEARTAMRQALEERAGAETS